MREAGKGDTQRPTDHQKYSDNYELTFGKKQPEQICRNDGRCQYAIDSGAEGMGHCPKGKCVMPSQPEQEPVAGLHAVYFRNNWDGEGDLEYVLAHLSKKGEWTLYENGAPLIEFNGDEIIKTWPLTLEITTPKPAQI